MKKFLAVYMGSESDLKMKEWNSLDQATRKAKAQSGMSAWMKWMNDHKQSIVDAGSPLGITKKITTSGVADTKNLLAGYVLVEAESQEAAAKLFIDHPHFSIFPGDSVEIMECLPIPSM